MTHKKPRFESSVNRKFEIFCELPFDFRVLRWHGSAMKVKGQSDEGTNALLRLLPMTELNDAYRRAKADETEKGQHAAKVIGREIIRRRMNHPDQPIRSG